MKHPPSKQTHFNYFSCYTVAHPPVKPVQQRSSKNIGSSDAFGVRDLWYQPSLFNTCCRRYLCSSDLKL